MLELVGDVVECWQLDDGDWVMYTVSQKNDPTLKWYNSKLYGSILMIFGRNIQKTLE